MYHHILNPGIVEVVNGDSVSNKNIWELKVGKFLYARALVIQLYIKLL